MKQERIWPEPVLLPLPEENWRRMAVNDGWQICRRLTDGFLSSGEGWEDVEVPCQQPLAQEPYACRRTLEIPREWEGMRVFLRFDGVCCEASVYIGDTFVRSHYGGFVSWDCEITELADPGRPVRLTLLIKDDPGGICPFQFGGIIREVTLFAVPKVCISRFHAKTAFDSGYQDAVLTVKARLSGGPGFLRLSLTSPGGQQQILGTVQAGADDDIEASFPVSGPQKWDSEHPFLYQLTGELLCAQDAASVSETVCRNIGFRVIERRGNQVFLNGRVLKLRGVNHHDIHPLTGKAISGRQAEEDVRLFREANINFIRTSHYPPRPDFLDFCDRYGIYVEDETAVAFLGQGVDCRENDPAFTAKFMDQFAELIERDYSHPSVIIWSLANECFWGKNLALQNAYAHSADPDRLTIFSYPITQKETDDRADIWSMHYAAWDQPADDLVDSFNRSRVEPSDWPVLHDESTHIPCYARNDLRRDPGIRDFYGETISRFWDKLWNAQGALGCAIWAGIDDVWQHGRTGLSWGIVDAWRRKKPEYWHVRKAYAPVRVSGWQRTAEGLALTLENRFNHTNLSEVTVCWQLSDTEPRSSGMLACPDAQPHKSGTPAGSFAEPRSSGILAGPDAQPRSSGILANPVPEPRSSGMLAGPDAQPRSSGTLVIPVVLPDEGFFSLTFTDPAGYTVQEELLDISRKERRLPQSLPDFGDRPPRLEESASSLVISGDHFSLEISREKGQITEGKVDGVTVVTGGPALHLTGLPLPPWEAESVDARMDDSKASVRICGHYGDIRVCFDLAVGGSGRMDVSCRLADMPYASPRKLAMRIGDDTDAGGYEEFGIRFTVSKDMQELFWKKKGLWSVFPDWHIGRLSGRAVIFPEKNPEAARQGTPAALPDDPAFRPAAEDTGMWKKPSGLWKDDLTDPLLFGRYDLPCRGSRDTRSLKTGIFLGGVSRGKGTPAFCAFSDGSHSIRLERRADPRYVIDDRDPSLVYEGTWYREDTGYASTGGTETWSQTEGDTCTCRFNGTGIAWYSSLDILGGIAQVLLDGEPVDPGISLGVRLLTPGIARGYEKDANRLVWSVTGLEPGPHSLTVRVAGKRAPGSMGSYVFIDHFVVLGEKGGGFDGDPDLIIDCAYNYPELSWGCYVKEPVRAGTGSVASVIVSLGREPDIS